MFKNCSWLLWDGFLFLIVNMVLLGEKLRDVIWFMNGFFLLGLFMVLLYVYCLVRLVVMMLVLVLINSLFVLVILSDWMGELISLIVEMGILVFKF